MGRHLCAQLLVFGSAGDHPTTQQPLYETLAPQQPSLAPGAGLHQPLARGGAGAASPRAPHRGIVDGGAGLRGVGVALHVEAEAAPRARLVVGPPPVPAAKGLDLVWFGLVWFSRRNRLAFGRAAIGRARAWARELSWSGTRGERRAVSSPELSAGFAAAHDCSCEKQCLRSDMHRWFNLRINRFHRARVPRNPDTKPLDLLRNGCTRGFGLKTPSALRLYLRVEFSGCRI